MGPWMDGCVPDSSRYVPGLRLPHEGRVEFPPLATSVANETTRGPCAGGTLTGPAEPTGQVVGWLSCRGLGAVVAAEPRPPPNCPTMVKDVGTGAGRIFTRRTLSAVVEGTVMTTGDQPAAVGFSFEQVTGAT